MDLPEQAYRIVRGMPRAYFCGLADQNQRAATSVPANIAEGYGREGTRSCIHFLKVARGSPKEFEPHAILAQRVGLLDAARVEALLMQTERIGKMLSALIRSVQAEKGARANRL
jgi:four helix bundle protein